MDTELNICENTNGNGVFTAWLVHNGKNVAYFRGKFNKEQLFLWTIETRPEYRNKGYAKDILSKLVEHFNVADILHEGGYTPDGYAYILPHVIRAERAEPAQANFEPMDFIRDWDNRIKETSY